MGSGNFSEEFKRDAVAQITERGYPAAEVSQRLGVSQHPLYAWKKKFSKPSGSERVFRQGCKVRYAFVAVYRQQFTVRAMCRCLRIRPSDFYAWLKNPPSKRAREGARQTALLSKAWKESGRLHGFRKLPDDLLDQGETGLPHRIARLAGLAVVIDLFSRRVIGWSLPSRQTTDVVQQALLMAVWRREPKSKFLVQSDQGSQLTNMDWAAFLKHHNLEHSMSRRGNCPDNARVENFFNLLKRARRQGGTCSTTSRCSRTRSASASGTGCCHPSSSNGSRKRTPRVSTKLRAIQHARGRRNSARCR